MSTWATPPAVAAAADAASAADCASVLADDALGLVASAFVALEAAKTASAAASFVFSASPVASRAAVRTSCEVLPLAAVIASA